MGIENKFEVCATVYGLKDKDKNKNYGIEVGSSGIIAPTLGEELEIIAHYAEAFEEMKNLTPLQLMEMEKNHRYREYITKGKTLESQQQPKQDRPVNEI